MNFYEQRQQLGIDGEKQAFDYFLSRGYEIVQTNFRCKGGEIDLIVSKGPELYFVEVKTRSSSGFGDPLEAVHLYKQRRIAKATQFFLLQNQQYNNWQKSFMVLIVWLKGEETIFELFPQAFEMSGGY